MGKSQRNKGATAEREVFKIFNDELGLQLKRNLTQYQGSDADLHLYGFCIEIKRQESLSLGAWWNQVVTVARKCNEIPVLIYRQSRQPWRAITPLQFLWYGTMDDCSEDAWNIEWAATTLLEPVFTTILREEIATHHIKDMIATHH